MTMKYVVYGCLNGIFPKYSFRNQVATGDTAQISLDGAVPLGKLRKEGSDRNKKMSQPTYDYVEIVILGEGHSGRGQRVLVWRKRSPSHGHVLAATTEVLLCRARQLVPMWPSQTTGDLRFVWSLQVIHRFGYFQLVDNHDCNCGVYRRGSEVLVRHNIYFLNTRLGDEAPYE